MKTHLYNSNPHCRTVLDCKELRSELLEKYVFKYSYLVSPGYEQNFGSLILWVCCGLDKDGLYCYRTIREMLHWIIFQDPGKKERRYMICFGWGMHTSWRVGHPLYLWIPNISMLLLLLAVSLSQHPLPKEGRMGLIHRLLILVLILIM